MLNAKCLQLYLLSILITCTVNTYAQGFDSVLSKLDTEYKQEKLYLHFDRSVYSPGETIWLKTYLFTGNYPSVISKTVYTELLDDKGKVLERRTAPVLMSAAAAAFDIPSDFTGQVIYIRAYTKWMLNFDSSFIYTKAIPITTLKKISTGVSIPQTSLQFFPEGGYLIQDVDSRIAFKAVDSKGMPVNVSGDIVNNGGTKILSFKTAHDGMGKFVLSPKAGETYKAIWKDKTGKLRETPLPAARPTGIVLEVDNNVNNIEFKIKRHANVSLPYPFIYVVAHMNQQLLYRAKANMSKSNFASSIIPIDNLPAGIVQITLFTPDERPIAERITFINKSTSFFITDLNVALKDLGKKKKNVIQIDVPDTISCNLSIAVTDMDLDPVRETDNIFSGLLLTSDIKGYVHQPAYYFASEEDSISEHLDLVMMTNGWRRFNWENVLANNWPKIIYQPENYLAIEGQVSGLNRTLLANRELNAVLEFKDKKREFMNTPLKPDGKFSYPEMIFYDTAKIYYQFNNDKKKDLTSRATFQIKNNLLRTYLQLKPDSFLVLNLSRPDSAIVAKNIEVYKEQLSATELEKVKTLKEVIVTTKKKSKQEIMDEEYTSGLFSGGDARTIMPEDDPAFLSSQSIFDYLQGRIAGLQVTTGGAEPTVTWRGSKTALFMNEMEMDAAGIQSISMSEVAMVKIFSPPFFGAIGAGAGGAVAIYLKKGGGTQNVKGLDIASIPGYSPVKEFYSPDYSKPDQTDKADLRKTLYWNPFVITDKKNRRILLPFYNNDITKKFKIIIEGCNEDGKLTRIEKVLQ